MINLTNCSGCKYFKPSGKEGPECLATFVCKHHVSWHPRWTEITTVPRGYSVTKQYNTPEDGIHYETRAQ